MLNALILIYSDSSIKNIFGYACSNVLDHENVLYCAFSIKFEKCCFMVALLFDRNTFQSKPESKYFKDNI